MATKETNNTTNQETGKQESSPVLTNDIELTFINESQDQNNSDVVIFAKNVATDFDEIAVAWKVIQNCGRGWSHKFTYSSDFFIGASDSYGNTSNLNEARFGEKWEVVDSNSGSKVQLSNEPASSMNEVEMENALMRGSIDAGIYKGGDLYLSKKGVSPGQKAVFSFKPTIWIGVASQVVQGEVMNSAIISDINTEISLFGITKANIIMRGGGAGQNATPFTFELVPTS